MSFLTAALRGLLKCTNRHQACSTQVTCGNAAVGVKALQQQWSIPQRCLTLPPEKERGLKKRGKFQPSAWKRLHKHGIEAVLTTSSGRRRLFNRLIRGKHNLTVFDDFLAVKPRSAKTKKELRHEATISKPLRSRHNA
ncbi:uncharacterized protein LOC110460082 [Mizuhopecten yessoensis]|uniref:39S ribosomal protein L34, mitochondrial n=1 Tax=Mizuhopecten yessoensis TaxID=6573 RepID=A0A210Q333_MIZYE|nr:uncharacterized protein LOC110460082 [Mizuhopecten yessoensis]OWF43146.1 hypothetical protein KP79_PYT14824 [Mizuhopecten yessoensis]